MKEHIKKQLNNTKKITIISLIAAILIGVSSYLLIINHRENLFKNTNLQNVIGDSKIVSNQNLTLGFLSNGRIKDVNVKTGDFVKEGQVLATLDANNVYGALTQANAVYETAKANYEKILNGSTNDEISLSKKSLEIAEENLLHSKESLMIAINNSFTNANNGVNNYTNDIFNNPDTANPELLTSKVLFVNQQLENDIIEQRIELNDFIPNWKKELSVMNMNSDLENIANDSLLYLQKIDKYIENLNSLFTLYTSVNSDTKNTINNILTAQTLINNQITSLTNSFQSVSNAKKVVEQNNVLVSQKTSMARPEDLKIAKAQVDNAYGAIQIAEAAVKNTVIVAPSDGTILSVLITPGQIAISNSPAIEFLSKN